MTPFSLGTILSSDHLLLLHCSPSPLDQTPEIILLVQKKKKTLITTTTTKKESNIPPKPKCCKPKKAQALSFNLYNKMPNSPMIGAQNYWDRTGYSINQWSDEVNREKLGIWNKELGEKLGCRISGKWQLRGKS